MVEINTHIYRPGNNINTIPEKRKPIHPMATSAMSIHTPSGNCNTESVNTHINIHPVAILELILVRWQLIQAETINTITIIVFTKI